MEEVMYDGTFNGLLTAIYYIYKLKLKPYSIRTGIPSMDLFTESKSISTNEQLADKVSLAIKRKVSNLFYLSIQHCFRVEKENKELLILRLVRKILLSRQNIEHNMADADVAEVHRAAKQVNKEVHRMYAFVRFEKKESDIYCAEIEPCCNVLHLLSPFFSERYADQKWVIFDVRRGIGMGHEEGKITFFNSETQTRNERATKETLEESRNKDLWKCYFKSVNIAERSNLKLQMSHMPKRYWKQLPEMEK